MSAKFKSDKFIYLFQMNMPITCIVFGAGCRGECYSEYALDFPQQFKVRGHFLPGMKVEPRMS